MAEAIFITIPLSHYCEKARWGLDRTRLPYREDPHVPMLSRLATRRHEGGTVPLLIHGDMRLTDSTDILVHADACAGGDVLYPRDTQLRRDVDALEERFDTYLGTHVRRWAYSHLLAEKAMLRELWGRGAPGREAFFLPLIVPIARKLLPRAYKLTPDSIARSLNVVRDIVREVGERLKDGRRYLVADRFTAADLTFAALAAPAIFPHAVTRCCPNWPRFQPRCEPKSKACANLPLANSRSGCTRPNATSLPETECQRAGRRKTPTWRRRLPLREQQGSLSGTAMSARSEPAVKFHKTFQPLCFQGARTRAISLREAR